MSEEENGHGRLILIRVCSDAFQRRERASEDWAIRQREKEKLLELKKKLAEQQDHLTRLSQHMYGLSYPTYHTSAINSLWLT